MTEIKFVYPLGGYVYLNTEEPKVTLSVANNGEKTENYTINGIVTNYYGEKTQEFKDKIAVNAGENGEISFDIVCKKFGYYFVDIDITSGSGETIKKTTGLGLTTAHERSAIPDSCFGVSCNYEYPEWHYPLFAKMGIRYLRAGVQGKEHLLKKYGMQSCIQAQGKDAFRTFWGQTIRYAQYKDNTAYLYEKRYGDLAFYKEHGNEHWEERNLMLLTEWHKVTGLARLEADPKGWYANSGCPGVDIEKLRVMFDNGLADYITSLSMHAYSFPGSPEGTDSYWSVARLNDLGKLMDEYGINVPVCCTEQGYPAMYDQTKCESYSPGEMATLEGQADYLVRSWAMYLSQGISKIIWFNGPWYDGFGIIEKEGPAPWPAAMALTELIRQIDHCDYIGDYEKEKGTYFKVFRNRNTSKLVGILWHPVYYARSSIKELNLSLDGKYTEADGKAQELFDYKLHNLSATSVVKDIMGNEVDVSNGTVKIGESPLYVCDLNEDIVPLLVDKQVFHTRDVIERPMPSKIILGLCDAWPPAGESFLTSKFKPGETRTYKLRVHNYSDDDLNDTIVIDAPKPFKVNKPKVDVFVKAGQYKELELLVTCDDVAACGEYKIHAKSTNTDAHPVYQIAAVYTPVYVKTVNEAVKEGSELTICYSSYAQGTKTYNIKVASNNGELAFEKTEFNVEVENGKVAEIPLKLTRCAVPCEPVINLTVTDGENTTNYDVVIPMAYIEYAKTVDANSLKDKQKFMLSGYNLTMSAGVDYKGPELFGLAKPAPLNAYARIEADDAKLYFHFDIYDDTVVCNKNTRRNNIDSDGVWIRLYKNMDDKNAVRHFCIMPVDQKGQTKGCSVDEVSANILFASPHTDYDFSKIAVKSDVFKDHYTIDVAVERDSIGLAEFGEDIIFDFRVINMNHNDWSKFYDTGKIAYKIIK